MAEIDPVFISLITGIDEDDTFYRLAKNINQIKEDYAVARLLLVQSQYRVKYLDNISERTTFINTLDYSVFNIYLGLLKSAFKEAYGILDKTSLFINEYYELGFKEKDIYFDTIWRNKKDGSINEKIYQSKNISLYALLDIYKDFDNGHCRKIKSLRHALIHRKMVIYKWTDDFDEDKDFNISYETMLEETIHLLRLSKSAIIYLINFVNMEEDKKRKNSKVFPVFADTSQFL